MAIEDSDFINNKDNSQTNGTEDEDTSNINLWEKILSESTRSVSDRIETKTTLILGDRNCGKSTLLARVQGLDIRELKKGVALDYSFIDVFSSPEEDDPVSRINVWQLEGDVEYDHLIKFGVNASNVAHSLIVIALDFSQPWHLVASLRKWLSVVEKYLTSLLQQLTPGLQDELKTNNVADFLSYTEPTVGATSNSSTDASNNSESISISNKMPKKKKATEEILSMPLPEGALTKNLGIPILVVGCKTDSMAQLEKEYNYKESHFDFIQQYLRRICLEYGAALIYTSAKKELNCDLFLNYLRHRLYGFDFNAKPQLVEKETIFIPAGADSINKIKVDFDNQNLTKDFDEPFESVIAVPKRLQNMEAASIDPIVMAEDDQEFLQKHRETLEREDAKDKDKKKSGFLSSLQKLGGTAAATEGPTTNSIASPISSSGATGASNAVSGSGPSSAAVSAASSNAASPSASPAIGAKVADRSAAPSLGGEGKGEPTNEMLANFFNSLIQKDRSALPTLATSGSARKSSSIDLTKGLSALQANKTTPPQSPRNVAPGSATSKEEMAKQLLEKLKKQSNK